MGSGIKLHKYRDWSIKLKLLVITALLILCSVFLVSLLSYIRYTRDFEEQSARRVQQIIDQVSLNIDTYLDDLFRLSLSPYYSNAVMAALDRDVKDSEVEQLEKSRLIEDFLDEMMIIPRKDIIRVYILADSVYSSKRTQTGMDAKTDFKSFDWYREAVKTKEPVFVPVHVEQVDKDRDFKIFSIVRQLRSTKNSDKILGVIKVDANYTGIKAICDRVDMGQEGSLFIIDGNKNVIYPGSSHKKWADTLFGGLFVQMDGKSRTSFVTEIDNQKYRVNFSGIPRSNWTVIAVNSLGELNKKAVGTRNTAFLMAILCSVFAILILILYVKRFFNPLMTIVRLMKEVQKGNLSVRFDKAGNDEIGYLGSSFNTMVSNINEMLEQNTTLVKEVYETKLLQKEAQFNALYSQIRPHFIYNTLNMISLMIQCDKQEKAVENINKLSSILRSMANVDRETTVRTEMDLLDAYLSLQKDRYDGRLEYSVDIDPALLSTPVPALIFQPIVENAVIHGCEAKREKTCIRICGIKEGDATVFSIEDNGKGMSREALEALREKIEHPDKPGMAAGESLDSRHGIGLVNVNRRIKIKYGQEFGLKIDSKPGEGTRVKILLPALKTGGGNLNV